MHFALAPQHDFVGLRIVRDGDRGVFFGKLVERLTELHVVLALLRRDGDGEHRRIRRDLGDGCVRLFAGGQRVAGLGLVELGERHGLARRGGAALFGVLADELEHAGDAAGFVIRRDECGAVAGLASQHAHDRQSAAMRWC